jgi:hypothetical protein
MAIPSTRKVSKSAARKLWQASKSVTAVARTIGYTLTGTRRMLYRFGIRRK